MEEIERRLDNLLDYLYQASPHNKNRIKQEVKDEIITILHKMIKESLKHYETQLY